MTIKQDLSNIKAVVFDVDGTLYSGGIAFWIIVGDIFKSLLSFNERKVRNEMKTEDYGSAETFYKEFFRRLAKKTGKSENYLETWYKGVYMPYMANIIAKHKKPRENASKLINSFHSRGIGVHIFSDYSMGKEKIEGLGIDTTHIGKYYCAEDMGALKPVTRLFKDVCADLKLQPNEVLMIGDTPGSDGGAVSAGMPFVCIESKKTKKIDKNSVSYDILSWEEVCALVDILPASI